MDEVGYCEGDNSYNRSELNYIAAKSKCPIDFDLIKIDDQIKEQAKIICLILIEKTISKRIIVKHLKFISIFYAYQKLGIPVEPLDIAFDLDMVKSNMLTAFHTYNEIETGYRPDNINVTINDILKIYCNKLDISEMYNDVIIVANRVFEKNAYIKDTNMVQVAGAALLLHFLKINGVNFKGGEQLKVIVARLAHKSPETIKSLSRKIFIIDNSS